MTGRFPPDALDPMESATADGLYLVQKSGARFREWYRLITGGTASLTIDDTARTAEISALGGGTVDSVVAGTGISVDSTDPANPVVSATGGGGGGASFTSYTAYTPVLTATTTNPNLGTSPIQKGRYAQVGSGSGSDVRAQFIIQFGTSPNAGSGEYRISLPVPADVTAIPVGLRLVGSGLVYLAGGGVTMVTAALVDATHIRLLRGGTGTIFLGSSVPGPWQAGDQIVLNLGYEAA